MSIRLTSNMNKKDVDKDEIRKILDEIDKIKKDKDFPNLDEIFPEFKESMKDLADKNKDKDVRLYLYYIDFNDGKRIEMFFDIFHFNSLLNNILSEPFVQKAWNEIKEKFGKEIDEQELYKVFKFFIFISIIDIFLEIVRQQMSLSNLINKSTWDYYHYKTDLLFDGKLDQAKFKELIKKMWEYLGGEFYEKYKQYIEQKDKESK